jgi:predicted amidohydrolase
VNRVGEDGHGIHHRGDSQLIDFKGDVLAFCEPDKDVIVTSAIHKEKLEQFRDKFPVWQDADKFIQEFEPE